MQEPYAVVLHVRICAADWEESTSELYNSADLDPVVQSLQREIDVFKSKTTGDVGLEH